MNWVTVITVAIALIAIFLFVKWIVLRIEEKGRNDLLLEMKEKNSLRLRDVLDDVSKKEKLHEAVRNSLADNWDDIELRRKTGKINLRRPPAPKL